MKTIVIQNKVNKEIHNGNWELVVNSFDKEATVQFSSYFLNMIEAEVQMTFSVRTEEEFNTHNINGSFHDEDLSEVIVDGFEYVLNINGTEHEIDCSEWNGMFADLISEYFTPHEQ